MKKLLLIFFVFLLVSSVNAEVIPYKTLQIAPDVYETGFIIIAPSTTQGIWSPDTAGNNIFIVGEYVNGINKFENGSVSIGILGQFQVSRGVVVDGGGGGSTGTCPSGTKLVDGYCVPSAPFVEKVVEFVEELPKKPETYAFGGVFLLLGLLFYVNKDQMKKKLKPKVKKIEKNLEMED